MIWLPFSPSVTISHLIDAHILLPALLLNEGAHGLDGVWLVKVALRAPCPLCAEERVEKLVLGVLDPVDGDDSLDEGWKRKHTHGTGSQ